MDELPPLPELVDLNDSSAAEREMLTRVHELLLAAGPAPELSLALLSPRLDDWVAPPLPRYRAWLPRLAVAGALSFVAFAGGYLLHSGTKESYSAQMALIASSGQTEAQIAVGRPDPAGNRVIDFESRGLPRLERGYYELLLTRRQGQPLSCGSFRAAGKVRLTIPYDLRQASGWILVAHRPGQRPEVVLRAALVHL